MLQSTCTRSKEERKHMSSSRKVLLAPLALQNDQGHFVCIAIRDAVTEEIVDTVVTSHDLAEKAAIPLVDAQRIFEEAQAAVDRRLAAQVDQQA